MSALVILPTYEEKDNLRSMVEAILSQEDGLSVLVIDDNSPDGTGELAEELKKEYPERVHALHREGKLGLGSAYREGFRWGLEKGYKYIFEMDADFSHNPKYLPELLAVARRGADLVIGSRYCEGGGTTSWALDRMLLSNAGCLFARTLLGLHVADLTGGFKCFRREALERLDLDAITSTGYAFQIEVTYRCYQQGLKVEEIPIIFEARKSGCSKMSVGIIAEAAWLVWCLRFEVNRGQVLIPESSFPSTGAE